MRKLAYALPATLSFALAACGGGPDIDQIKADFQNPSGSVKNKDAMVAASGNLDASGSAIEVAGGGVPGASLSAAGKPIGFYQANIRRTWEPRARALRDYLNGDSSGIRALSEQSAFDSCENSAEAQSAYEEASRDILADAANPFGNSKKISGSASFKLDFGACSNGDLSGTAKVDIKIEAEQTGENSGRFAFTVEYAFDHVCDLTTPEKSCLDGSVVMEAEAVGADNFGSLTFTSGWQLDGTWVDAGVDRSASLKGGIRSALEGSGDTGSAKIEILNYVTSPEGEWSYVWTFAGSFDGEQAVVDVECRGSDGSASCHITEEGGTCSASDGSSVTWTAADEQSLGDDWFN
jgi:hypothetical protein